MPVLADTGPLYALVDPDDAYHGRARKELERLHSDRRPVVVATPILMEAYSLTLYRLGFHTAVRWLQEIKDGVGLLDPQRQDIQAAAERLRKYPDQRITLFDAVVAELSDRLAVPVWTFDHHFDHMRVTVWR